MQSPSPKLSSTFETARQSVGPDTRLQPSAAGVINRRRQPMAAFQTLDRTQTDALRADSRCPGRAGRALVATYLGSPETTG